jgi:hypothetical protein
MSTKWTVILVTTAAAMLLAGCGDVGDSQGRLRTALEAQKPTLDQCYARALERDEGEAGQMQVWVHVNSQTGKLEEVEVVDATVQDGQLKSCVEQALVGVQLDPAPAVDLQVEYFLRFNPTS